MNSRISTLVLILLALMINSCKNETKKKVESKTEKIDAVEVKDLLQQLNNQFAESFNNSDSVAIAEHYAKGGTWENIKGKDNLAAAWGKSIRYADKEKMSNLKFTVGSVSSHSEFLIETGSFQFSDLNKIVKSTGKYLIVRKLEDGKWKIYRDIGL